MLIRCPNAPLVPCAAILLGMAELDPDGEQFPPWKQFRFSGQDLETWFDGCKRTLTQGVDFPADAPFDEVKRRLEQAAHKRRGRARVWQQADGKIGIVLSPASWTARPRA